MKERTTWSKRLRPLALFGAAAVGLSAWAANAPSVTVNGTSVSISNEAADTYDNASLTITGYSGKAFTIRRRLT